MPSLPAKGESLTAEGHFNGGVGDLHKGQGLHHHGVAQCTADGDIRHAGQGHDLTGAGLLHGHLGQTVEGIQGNDLALGLVIRVVIVADGNLLVDLNGAPLDAAHGNPAHILIVVNGGDQQLQRAVLVARTGDRYTR